MLNGEFMIEINTSATYILLIITATLYLILSSLFIALKINKNTRSQTSIFYFFSLIALLIGIYLTLKYKTLFLLMITILVQGLLLVPHMVILLLRTNNTKTPSSNFFKFSLFKKIFKKQEVKQDSKTHLNTEVLKYAKNIISYSVKNEKNITSLGEFINTSLITSSKATGGALLLVDEFEDVLKVTSVSGIIYPPYKLSPDVKKDTDSINADFQTQVFTFTDNIFETSLKTGLPKLITDIKSNTHFAVNDEDEELMQSSSYLIIPLKAEETVIGISLLARHNAPTPFSEEDLNHASIIADFSGATLKNRYFYQEFSEHTNLKQEAIVSGNMQQIIYLKKILPLPSLNLGTFFNPAEGVCGDYFDINRSRKDRITFVLADIAGKGIISLSIMIMIRAILRVILNTTQTAAGLLGLVNRAIAQEKDIDHYASMALINYDPNRKIVQLSVAGNMPVLLFNSNTQRWEKISKAAEPLGVEKNTRYLDTEKQLKKDDILIVYTDGLIETVNPQGQQYTIHRLTKKVEEFKVLASRDIIDKVNSDIKLFQGSASQYDDQSLVIIKVE